MRTDDLHTAAFTDYIQRARRTDADAHRLSRIARRRRNRTCAG